MMRYLRTALLLLAGLSFMIPLLSKPLLAGHWSERRWSGAHWKHADIDTNALPDVAADSEPCTEIGQ
jgi:hypothetical protein